nr:hypothetical protein Iba_chr10dCG11500 [Ipomoea batatas]
MEKSQYLPATVETEEKRNGKRKINRNCFSGLNPEAEWGSTGSICKRLDEEHPLTSLRNLEINDVDSVLVHHRLSDNNIGRHIMLPDDNIRALSPSNKYALSLCIGSPDTDTLFSQTHSSKLLPLIYRHLILPQHRQRGALSCPNSGAMSSILFHFIIEEDLGTASLKEQL